MGYPYTYNPITLFFLTHQTNELDHHPGYVHHPLAGDPGDIKRSNGQSTCKFDDVHSYINAICALALYI